MKKCLSAHSLKLIAITAMLIDHIAWGFLPSSSPLAIVMHTIGRITFPIMCFFVAEGYYHTRNLKKYIVRLIIFAFISQIPFSYFQSGKLLSFYPNVIFTLLFGLIALIVCKSSLHTILKLAIVLLCCFFSVFGDWSLFGVVFVLVFGMNRGDFKQQAMWFSIVSFSLTLVLLMDDLSNLYMVGLFLAIPLLMCYNGKAGGRHWGKWLFYGFYPLHLIILGLIAYLVK